VNSLPLDRLYRSHGPAVLRRARQLLGSEAEAQEVLHDVFTSLVQRPEQFKGQSSIMTFLYAMTTHNALARLRQGRTRLRLLGAHHALGEPLAADPAEARAELRQLLGNLPEELAQVAVYYYLDEMTQDEIAELMGCSRQWVGKLVARLRAHSGREP
jgi:RNA polymerase sigma-70 factor (ECF subfamily)